MEVFAFVPKYNKKGRKDATGAFQPEAKGLLRYWKNPVKTHYIVIDNGLNDSAPDQYMRDQVLFALNARRAYSCNAMIAFLCHGLKTRIQFGFDNSNVHLLASAIAGVANRSFLGFLSIPLYACDTGRDADKDRLDDLSGPGGDGGFADALRDALSAELEDKGDLLTAFYVDAHTLDGHTTHNPYVRRFGGIVGGGLGGYYLISPGSTLWQKWRKALKTSYRFQFPCDSARVIHTSLAKAR